MDFRIICKKSADYAIFRSVLLTWSQRMQSLSKRTNRLVPAVVWELAMSSETYVKLEPYCNDGLDFIVEINEGLRNGYISAKVNPIIEELVKKSLKQ